MQMNYLEILSKKYCKVIRNKKKLLNPYNPEDVQLIFEMLEESDKDEEDDNFHLHLSDDEENEEIMLENDLVINSIDSVPFTPEELNEPSSLQVTERALVHKPPQQIRIQTRSQAVKQNKKQAETSIKFTIDNRKDIEEKKDNSSNEDFENETEEEEEEDIIN